MTTVAALAVDGAVYMAADTMTNVYDRPVASGRKILRMPAGDGEVLIGISGDAGLPGALLANLKIDGQPADGEDPESWAWAVASAITDIAVEAGLVESGRLDGHLLLACRGRLWTIAHRQAIWHPDGRGAIGSGEGPAIGALDAFLLMDYMGPAEAVARAVKIASERDRYTGGTIQVEALEAV
ncbi:MAG TPA: hypothetical protein VF174_10020 [Micromonosporaceae bacterium]